MTAFVCTCGGAAASRLLVHHSSFDVLSPSRKAAPARGLARTRAGYSAVARPRPRRTFVAEQSGAAAPDRPPSVSAETGADWHARAAQMPPPHAAALATAAASSQDSSAVLASSGGPPSEPPAPGRGGGGDGDGDGEGGSVPLAMALWRAYNRLLARYPFRTNAAQAALIGGTGDMIAQWIEGKRDGRRRLKMFAWGLCFAGPMSFFFYRWLDGRFPSSVGWPNVLRKVALNATMFTPVINAVFLAFSRSVELASDGRLRDIPAEVRLKVAAEWPGAYRNSFRLWPAAHCINFAFVPAHLRVLYISCVAVGWTAYLSFIGHRHRRPQSA